MTTTHNFDILHFKTLLSSLTMRHKLKAGEKHFDATITDNTNPGTTEDTAKDQESIVQHNAENDLDSNKLKAREKPFDAPNMDNTNPLTTDDTSGAQESITKHNATNDTDSEYIFFLMNKISEREKEMKSSICRLEKENAELKVLLNSNHKNEKGSSDISENEDQKLPPAVELQTQNSSKIRTAPVYKVPSCPRKERCELKSRRASFNNDKSSRKQPLPSSSAFKESTRPKKFAKSLQVDVIVADSLMTKKKPVVEIDDRVRLINESKGMDQERIEYDEKFIEDILKSSDDESSNPEKAVKDALQINKIAADAPMTEKNASNFDMPLLRPFYGGKSPRTQPLPTKNKAMIKVGDLVRIAHDWKGTGLVGFYGTVYYIHRKNRSVDFVDNTCEFNEDVLVSLRVQDEAYDSQLKYLVNYTLLPNADYIFMLTKKFNFNLNGDPRLKDLTLFLDSNDNYLNMILEEYYEFIGNVKRQLIEKRNELMSYMRWKAHKDFLEEK